MIYVDRYFLSISLQEDISILFEEEKGGCRVSG